MSWRYYAYRWTGELLHADLPLVDVAIEHALSAPGGLSASIDPAYMELQDATGRPVLREWDTLILAEADGVLRGGGIIASMTPGPEALELDCVGPAAYAVDHPVTSNLVWGGSSAGTTGNGVDPATVVLAIWAQIQQTNGPGIVVDPLTTPYRLGAWHNARRLPTADQPNPPVNEVEDPPIPIDRVWTSADKKPAAARGKTVYWRYAIEWHEDVTASARIDELHKQTPMDYRERWEWVDRSAGTYRIRLERGYPRLGRRRDDLRFVQGENLPQPIDATYSGDEYANQVVAYGAGEGAKQLRATATINDGRLRRIATIDAPDVSTAAALRTVAQDEMRRRQPTTQVNSIVVDNHPHAPIGSYAVGDDIYVQGRTGWGDINLWVRITDLDINPHTERTTITCARSDSFRYDGGGQ